MGEVLRTISSAFVMALVIVGAFVLVSNVKQAKTELLPLAFVGGQSPMQDPVGMASIKPPPAEWNKTYGGTGPDVAQALVQTDDGGYALAGHTASVSPFFDFWLVRVDSLGNHLWSKTYGRNGVDSAYALVQTGDGGYAIAGYTNSFGPGDWDFWLVRTDSLGDHLWNKTYGGIGNDYCATLVQMADGGYVLAGSTDSFGAGSYDWWLVRVDSFGNHLWNRTYGGTGDDWASGLVQTDDGGYAIVGYTESFGVSSVDFWLVKTDANGYAQWNRTYGGASGDCAYALVQTSDGRYTMAGCTSSLGSWDFWLVTTDAAGNHLWNRTYGGIGTDYCEALVQTKDGGYALAGSTNSFGVGWSDFWLVRTDSLGNHLWNQTCGGASDDWAFALLQTSDGGYALAGSTNSFGAGWSDFWLVKLVPPIPGDVDHDGDVDIFDMVHMASVYGVAQPDPRYDPDCDIDGDGDIDIFDIVIAAANYGKSW